MVTHFFLSLVSSPHSLGIMKVLGVYKVIIIFCNLPVCSQPKTRHSNNLYFIVYLVVLERVGNRQEEYQPMTGKKITQQDMQ